MQKDDGERFTEYAYFLNIFGCVYPEIGKRIFKNEKAVISRIERYKKQILSKFSKNLNKEDLKDLHAGIENGYSCLEIDIITCKNFRNLFCDCEFKKNKDQKWNKTKTQKRLITKNR